VDLSTVGGQNFVAMTSQSQRHVTSHEPVAPKQLQRVEVITS